MYGDYKITLGVAPTRRDVFPPRQFALENKERVMAALSGIFAGLDGVEIVGIEDICADGLLMDLSEIPAVVRRFQERGVDALFVPHVNFGQEEAVAKLAKAVGRPVLLWGPRDDRPPEDLSTRKTDTQCGLFVSGKALRSHGVPFTYLENCWMDSPVLKKGIEDFVRVACVAKRFRNMRVGQISVRPRQFLSVRVNESSLQERLGVDVVAITGAEVLQAARAELEGRDEAFARAQKDLRETVDLCQVTEDQLDRMVALERAYLKVANAYRLDALAVDCWHTFPQELGIVPCFANGNTADCGLPVACECDIHGAISMALLQAAARGERAPFLADLTMRHPDDENGELLWHCGPFPKSLAKPGVKPAIVDCQGRYELADGALTLARFEDDCGRYLLLSEQAEGIDGPKVGGNYLWIKVDDWVRWEKKLVMGPYIHHIGAIHGEYAGILREACRYLGGVAPDSISEV